MPGESELLHIIKGCIEAKRESQKAFYKLYYGYAMAVCMRYCGSNEDAMEVVNDSFLKIFNGLHRFSPKYEDHESSLRGWMKRILVYTAVDHFRKNQKNGRFRQNEDDHLEKLYESETSIDKLSYKELIETVQQLSPVYRTVFNLYVIDGFKHEEIAEKLRISVGASKSNLAKARANIQKMLKKANESHYEQKAV